MSPGGWGRRGAAGGLCPESSRGSWAAPSSSPGSCLSQAAPCRPPPGCRPLSESPAPAPPPAFSTTSFSLSFGFQVQCCLRDALPDVSPLQGAPPRPALCSLCSPPFCLPIPVSIIHSQVSLPAASSTSQNSARKGMRFCSCLPSMPPEPKPQKVPNSIDCREPRARQAISLLLGPSREPQAGIGGWQDGSLSRWAGEQMPPG